MGRLTEYFGRLNQRSTRRLHHSDYTPAAFPGPLETPDDPPHATRRERAARAAVRALMAMKADGQTDKLTRRFDAACKVIDDEDGDLGPIIRGKVFDWQPDDGVDHEEEAKAD